MTEDNETSDNSLPVAQANAVARLIDKIPVRSLNQLDRLGDDKLALHRFKSLHKIATKAARFAEEKGIDTSQAKTLALHVGLPWMEKASLCEEQSLQEKWAMLLLSSATAEQPEYDEGATYVRILAELNPWDCKVLDYMVEHGGLSKHLFRQVDRDELLAAVPGPENHPGRTVQSLEKLVRCGCLVTEDVHVSRPDAGVAIYGGIKRVVVLTLTGLNFHMSVSADAPVWLSEEDEYRDDINPVNQSAYPKVVHERFLRLVKDFSDTHFELLRMAEGDLREIRDYVESIDGKRMGAVAIEGRNPHFVKPCAKAWQELCEQGLVYEVDVHTIMSEEGYKNRGRTALGDQFLQFIAGSDTS